jgi:glycerophosphoryl diester phosphodiesterase
VVDLSSLKKRYPPVCFFLTRGSSTSSGKRGFLDIWWVSFISETMTFTPLILNQARCYCLVIILVMAGAAQARELTIVAHRGANHLAPENTLAAATKCVELGVDYVEIDVRTSRDGVMYLLHDKTLDRTTNGSGEIKDRDSAYIDGLDAGSWFSSEFKGERVPRLESFLSALKGKMKIYFDVKDAELGGLLKLIYANGFEQDSFFWFSDDQRALELRKLDPAIALKMNAVDVDGLKRVLAFHPQIIEYRLENLTPEFAAFARANNLELMAHALEPGAEKNYPAIIKSAATMVNLDKADLMLELLGKSVPIDPVRRTLTLDGVKREYFVWLPKTYWPLVSVHGGGGNGKTHFLAPAIRAKADLLGLDAIVVGPSFSNDDFQASRFPALGEGEFLLRVLEQINQEFRLHPKILLTGYSRGGQIYAPFRLCPSGVGGSGCSFLFRYLDNAPRWLADRVHGSGAQPGGLSGQSGKQDSGSGTLA